MARCAAGWAGPGMSSRLLMALFSCCSFLRVGCEMEQQKAAVSSDAAAADHASKEASSINAHSSHGEPIMMARQLAATASLSQMLAIPGCCPCLPDCQCQ